MRRIYPISVTIIGGLGLGLALTYLVGVVLAFVPGWEDWADFFVPRALYLLIVPYVLLVGHLVLRNHVGRFLVGRGAYEEAVEYASRRMKASLARSSREVANQTIACARGHIGLGHYDEAQELLAGGEEEFPGSYAIEARRWQFEIALRRDDRPVCKELAVDEPGRHSSARGNLAAILACEAELGLRDGDQRRYEERLEDAFWEDASHPRVTLVRGLGMMEFEDDDEEGEEVLDLLASMTEPIGDEIPARRAELQALRAIVARRRGDGDEARRLLDDARRGPTDHWTDVVVDRAQSVVDDDN